MKYFETEKVELKRNLNETFEKEVVAFLNTHDGVVYIGIEDNGIICGVEKIDENMKKISDIISTGILPNPQELISVTAIYEDRKIIIKVDVKKGNALYYISKYGRSSKGCYVRVGTSCRSMTEDQIEKTYLSYIELPAINMKEVSVLRKDYSFIKFKNYLSSNGINYNESNFIDNFNLTTEKGKFNLLAELLSDENTTSIKVAVFKGKDKSKFIKRNEYGYTCILYSLQQVLDYCKALNDTYVDLSISPRREVYMFNFEAVKEAWINACVHNKWVDGIPPAIYWFDDRMEIVSYGGIPKGLTKEQFLSGKTKPVNKELMNIFLQCKIVDQSGHGVPIIVKEYGEKAYQFFEDSITVVIPFNKNGFEEQNVGVNVGVNVGINLNKTQKLVYMSIYNNPHITYFELAEKVSKSEETIRRNIKSLVDFNLIRRVGSNKNGHWEIIK